MSHWQHTFWFCSQLVHTPQMLNWFEIPSVYVSIAEETSESEVYSAPA